MCGKQRKTLQLTYPDWAAFPRFLQVAFHGCFWCILPFRSIVYHIRGVIFHTQRSSVTDSFHDLHGLPLPWQPDTSIWVQHFIQSSLLATCPYHLSHLRRFILNLDSNGWRLNREYKSCRLTSSQLWPYTSNATWPIHFSLNVEYFSSKSPTFTCMK